MPLRMLHHKCSPRDALQEGCHLCCRYHQHAMRPDCAMTGIAACRPSVPAMPQVKVLRCIKPVREHNVVLGQYVAADGQPGYTGGWAGNGGVWVWVCIDVAGGGMDSSS